MKYNFLLGTPKIFKILVASLTLAVFVSMLHSCTKIEKDRTWKFIVEYQRYFQIKEISLVANNIILTNLELLQKRIKNDIDRVNGRYQIQIDKTEHLHMIIKYAIFYQCNPNAIEAHIPVEGSTGSHYFLGFA